MQTGDIIFIHGTSPLDRTIEFFDKGKFNHVCMVMPNGTIVETQFPTNTRCIPNPYLQSDITVIDLGLTDKERQTLAQAYFKYLPDKYDLREIFGILLHDIFGWNTNKTWHSKNKLICSQLVVDLLNEIDYFKKRDFLYDTSNLTPNQLYRILNRLQSRQSILG